MIEIGQYYPLNRSMNAETISGSSKNLSEILTEPTEEDQKRLQEIKAVEEKKKIIYRI